MRTSVILSSYNGEKYIEEQLYSLLNQSEEIDEVIVIDDCSCDSTTTIVENFIKKNNCKRWKLIINKKNKGWKASFITGLELATGDILFPCDQDDVWHHDKIEVMKKIMQNNEKILLLEGKPHRFYDEESSKAEENQSLRVKVGTFLDKISNKKKKVKNTGEICKKNFDDDFLKRAPGCCLAIRKDYFDSISKYWFDEMPHDALITYMPNLIDGYYEMDYEVIEWRQHAGSASRPTERNKKNRIKEIELDEKMILTMLVYARDNRIKLEYKDELYKALKWNRYRMELVKNDRVWYAILILKYRKFYLQFRRYFTDIKYGLEKKK